MGTFTDQNKKDHVNNVQCNFSDHMKSMADKLTIGEVTGDDITNIRILSSYIRVMKKYNAFEDEVLYSKKFCITKPDDDESITIEIKIKDTSTSPDTVDTFTYSNSGDAKDIASFFVSEIDSNSPSNLNVNYKTILDGNCVIVYSTDADATNIDSDSITITSGNEDGKEVSKESITSSDILNKLNCITESQFCSMQSHALEIMNEDCGCN